MADGPAQPLPTSLGVGGGHQSGGDASPRSNVWEQDWFLPIANISRIMKKVIPANGKIAKDAKETMQECMSEFISFITSEVSDKCQREKRKTINGDDLLWAVATLGFEDYIEPLKNYLQNKTILSAFWPWSIVVILGLTICAIYWGVNNLVLNDPSLPKSDRKKKKEKPKLGMKESMKFLFSSGYVRDLATLVVAYGISINLVEVTWKLKLKPQFPSPNEYSSFMGDFSTSTGTAIFTMMLLSRVILSRYGWGVAAMITPTVLLRTGVGFFSLILFGEPLTPVLGKFGMTPLLAAVYVGALQNIFSKSAKYGLYSIR